MQSPSMASAAIKASMAISGTRRWAMNDQPSSAWAVAEPGFNFARATNTSCISTPFGVSLLRALQLCRRPKSCVIGRPKQARSHPQKGQAVSLAVCCAAIALRALSYTAYVLALPSPLGVSCLPFCADSNMRYCPRYCCAFIYVEVYNDIPTVTVADWPRLSIVGFSEHV